MSKRFVLTEDEKESIKKLYMIEQSEEKDDRKFCHGGNVKTLEDIHPMTYSEADGPSIFDKPSRYIGEKFGSWILGIEGEVRISVQKVKA